MERAAQNLSFRKIVIFLISCILFSLYMYYAENDGNYTFFRSKLREK